MKKFFGSVIMALVLVFLLTVSFVISPSIYNRVNVDYVILGPQLREDIISSSKELQVSLERKRVLEGQLSSAINEVNTIDNSSIAEEADLPSANPDVIPKNKSSKVVSEAKRRPYDPYYVPPESSSILKQRRKDLISVTNRINTEIKETNEEIEKHTEDRNKLSEKLERMASDGTNLYLSSRALSLGALGAIAAIFASLSVSDRSIPVNLTPERVAASAIVGSLVSIVAFGLFYTKQVTIFKADESLGQLPDFWKMTILCLVAGAFSEKLFQAAGGRVSHYLGNEDRPVAKHDADRSNHS